MMQCVVSVKWYILNGNKYITGKSMVIIYVDVDGAFRVLEMIKDIFVIDSSFGAFEYQHYETVSKNIRYCQYNIVFVILLPTEKDIKEEF